MRGQSLRRRLRYLVLKAEIKDRERITLDSLRHTIATFLLDIGRYLQYIGPERAHKPPVRMLWSMWTILAGSCVCRKSI